MILAKTAKLGPGFGRVLVFITALVAGWTALFVDQWFVTGFLPAADGLVDLLAQSGYQLLAFSVTAAILAFTGWYFVQVTFGREPKLGAWVPDFTKPKPERRLQTYAAIETPAWLTATDYEIGEPRKTRYESRWDPESGKQRRESFRRDLSACQALFTIAYIIASILVVVAAVGGR